MKESKCKNMFGIILIAVILLISVAISDRILLNSYGQTLDKTYTNQKCGISIQYPSNWKINEKLTEYKSRDVINFIVDFQPDNDEGFNNVVGIQLFDISTLSDKSIAGVKDFEEDYITTGSTSRLETSETTQVAGYPAQKIVYTDPGLDNERFKNMEVDIVHNDIEYKLTYETTNANYFDKYLSIFEDMVNSFVISEPTFDGITC